MSHGSRRQREEMADMTRNREQREAILRQRVGKYLADGVKPKEVAEALNISTSLVSRVRRTLAAEREVKP